MQGKKSIYMGRHQMEHRRRTQIRNWIILVGVIVAVLVGLHLLRGLGGKTELEATTLPCYANQSVTPFGEDVLYYDGTSIHCASALGAVRWSFPIGEGADFSVSDTNIVVWVGSQLYIVNSSGKSTYNENMGAPVQFARIGKTYAAVVIGEDTEPELIIKDLRGSQVDEEVEAFSGMLLLDTGFYGDQGQYMWTLAMDVYGVAINTVMNTFQVGKMNTGVVSLGEHLTYDVLFENNRLRVFTTQQMYTYDYKGVQDMSSTMLVYGWKLIDHTVPARGDGSMLLAPTSQTNSIYAISELRLVRGTFDRRYTLPSVCVGAAIRGDDIYAVSGTYLYRNTVTGKDFQGYALPLPEGAVATGFIGLTTNNRAIIASGDTVYSISLPD